MSSSDSLGGGISAEVMQSVSKWYYGNITFDQANRYLRRFPVGTGLVRKSSQDDKLVLVVNESEDSATCNHLLFDSRFKAAPNDAELQKVINTVLTSKAPMEKFPKQIIWTASSDDASCDVKKGQKFILLEEEVENQPGKALLLSPDYVTIVANPSYFISTKTRVGSENLASKIMNRQSGPAKSRRSATNSESTTASRHSRDSAKATAVQDRARSLYDQATELSLKENDVVKVLQVEGNLAYCENEANGEKDKPVYGKVFDYYRSEFDLLFIEAEENDELQVLGWNVVSNLYTVKNKHGVKGKIPKDCMKLDKRSNELMNLYHSHYETA